MNCLLRLLLAAFVCALSLTPASEASAQDRASVRDLTRRIAKERDAVDLAVFQQLAEHRDLASFKALAKSIPLLKEDGPRAALYNALHTYAPDPELAERAMDLLQGEVGKARTSAWQLSALTSLVLFGESAVPRLEPVASEHPDAACRTLATDLLSVRFLDRGDVPGLTTVLRNATLSQTAGIDYLGIDAARLKALRRKTHRAVMRKLLRERLNLESLPHFGEALLRAETSRVWKLFLVRLIDDHASTEASALLHAACGDVDTAAALLAIDLLTPRERYADREKAFRPLLRSKEPSLRRAAVLALGKVLARTPSFADEVQKLARSRDSATRMGAAGALVDVGDAAALETLHKLLTDPEWSVRIEALQRVGHWRKRESIPHLIARMEAETGRMPRDVQAALVAVTRIDLGRRHEAWRAWWERESETYVLPDRDAREVRTKRTEPVAGASVARSFYDIRVLSARVAFVLDVSGSMRNRSARSQGTVEVSRMDVAKEQLSTVLRNLPEWNALQRDLLREQRASPRKGAHRDEEVLAGACATLRARAVRDRCDGSLPRARARVSGSTRRYHLPPQRWCAHGR